MEDTSKKPKVLIVDSDSQASENLKTQLSHAFEVLTAENGITAVESARKHLPEVLLIEENPLILSKNDITSLLKKDSQTKDILILQSDETSGIAARIQSLIQIQSQSRIEELKFENLCIIMKNHCIQTSRGEIQLTPTEFEILCCLVEKVDQTVSRDEITNRVWKERPINASSRTIDVHIRSIRKKLPEITRNLTSIYGVGYRLRELKK